MSENDRKVVLDISNTLFFSSIVNLVYNSFFKQSEEPECLIDTSECQWNGSKGFCCSGNCVQDANEPKGECEPRVIESTTTTATPSTIITSTPTSSTATPGESNVTTTKWSIIGVSVSALVLLIILGFIWFCRRRIRKRVYSC